MDLRVNPRYCRQRPRFGEQCILFGNLQNIQQSLSGKSIFGIDDLGTTFGAVIPIIESVKGLIGQIVDLGVNHIKPLLADIMSFAVNELFPAVSPLISMIISLVGTTLINAIKLVVDVIHGLLPVIEPVIQGIVGLIKGIVSVTITVANAIIGTLNKLSLRCLIGCPPSVENNSAST